MSLIKQLNSVQDFIDQGNYNIAKVELILMKIEKTPDNLITPTARYLLIESLEKIISNL